MHAVLERRRAPGAVHGAFCRSAVIPGEIDHQGVVKNTGLHQVINDLFNLGIGMRHKTGEDFHQA